MIRVTAAVCLLAGLSTSPLASEVCVSCETPAATYRCSIDRAALGSRIKLGDAAERKVCEMVLSRLGPHGTCKIIEQQPCNGVAKSLTLADYQRALAGNEEQTYQPSMLEQAQNGMSKTWTCMASLFKDC